MKMKSKFLLCILLTIGMVLLHVGLYFGDNQYTASDIQPVNGLIRLTKSDLKKNSLIFLCRDWQVYPDALLSPEDFSSGEADTYTADTLHRENTAAWIWETLPLIPGAV